VHRKRETLSPHPRPLPSSFSSITSNETTLSSGPHPRNQHFLSKPSIVWISTLPAPAK
jgi:hypothetical protein